MKAKAEHRYQIDNGGMMRIPLKPCESGILKAFGYDEKTRTLFVQFMSGKIARYSGVPLGEFETLRLAKSKGKFFHAHIRNAYEWAYVNEDGEVVKQ